MCASGKIDIFIPSEWDGRMAESKMQQPVAETEEMGMSLSRVLATGIVVRENRGLNVAKLLALKESISLGLWHITSLLIVILLACEATRIGI